MSPEAETPEQLEKLYPSIKPYTKRGKPTPGGIASSYLEYVSNHDRWVATNELHHIYRSPFGTHDNMLIKLAKSGYLETRADRHIILAETNDGQQPVERETRFWRITEKGKKYVDRYCLSPEELVEYNTRRLMNYIETKSKSNLQWVIEGNTISLTITDNDGYVYPTRIELLDKPIKWQPLYWWMRDRGSQANVNKEDEQKLAEAEQWIKERPELVDHLMTPYGKLTIEGTMRHNYFELKDEYTYSESDLTPRWNKGKYVCIEPEKQLHWTDMYIWRLQMINWHPDQLYDIMIRKHILIQQHCESCKTPFDWMPNRYLPKIHFCPVCGGSVDKQVEELKRIEKA